MQCPNCKLINPDNASRCDCGYDFQTDRTYAPHLNAASPDNDTSEDIKALRQMAERKHKAETTAGMITLLLFALGIGWCVYANKAVESDKRWCREAPAKQFVDQYEARCAQYRTDPAIKARIERIMAGEEK